MRVAQDKPWRFADGMLLVRVRITTRAGEDAIAGVQHTADGPAISARVRPAPEDGKANAALEKLIAGWLGLPKTSVRVAAGARSRIKTLALSGQPSALERLMDAKLSPLASSPEKIVGSCARRGS
jgi:uncharacterized protein YggU (UPF0235/DUF167 family)